MKPRITSERAREILSNIDFSSGSMEVCASPPYPPTTDEEDTYIKDIWGTLSGSSSYVSTLWYIMGKGE
jgi:hypothetical protein